MIYEIHNDILAVAIASKGAELQSIINKETGIEYLWNGDAKFWGKKSPVLFPIVGGLKNNSYTYQGTTYQMGRHGFAREMEFDVKAKTNDAITFTLKSNDETLAKYPFQFSFSLRYTLNENKLSTTYIVENTANENLLFSVGAHPAFKVPLIEETNFEDYFLQFGSIGNADRWPLSADGLIETTPTLLLNNTNTLPLTKELFYEDAMVFKHLSTESISIRSNKTTHGIKVNFPGFPYMGIWNAKGADFICIEPWCGIADSVVANGNIEEKEGINSLAPAQIFERTWTVELF